MTPVDRCIAAQVVVGAVGIRTCQMMTTIVCATAKVALSSLRRERCLGAA